MHKSKKCSTFVDEYNIVLTKNFIIMKKHALLLIGFFVAIVVAVLFAACEKKESGNGGGGGGGGTTTTSKLIGSWKYVDSYDNMTINVTFKADNTGILKRYVAYENKTYTSEFYYNYDASQETVTMKVQYEEYGYTDYETIKAGLTWYGNDRFFFRYLDYGYSGDDDYEIGPFVRQ